MQRAVRRWTPPGPWMLQAPAPSMLQARQRRALQARRRAQG
jgi:hypothetical protein